MEICRSLFVYPVSFFVQLEPVIQSNDRHDQIDAFLCQIYRIKVDDIHGYSYEISDQPPHILFGESEHLQDRCNDPDAQGERIKPRHFSTNSDQDHMIDNGRAKNSQCADDILGYSEFPGLCLLAQLFIPVLCPMMPGDEIGRDIEEDLQGSRSPDMPVDQIYRIDDRIDRGKKEIADISFSGKEDADDTAYSADEIDDRQPGRIAV